MPVASRLDRQGAAGSSARSCRPIGARERSHRRLVDRRLDVGMAYAVRCRRLEAGAPVAEVVEIGAGHDRRLGARRNRAVQVGLAEEAAVGRVGEVVGVGELAGIDDRETPALAARMVLDAGGSLGRHRGRYRVHHLRAVAEPASCRHGKRHAVDAAAHRDRDRADAREHRIEFGRLLRDAAQSSSFGSSARASAARRRLDRTACPSPLT